MNRRGHSGRVDANHEEIVAALRKAGCTVQSIASIGAGCPDVLAGCNGFNVLLEIKVPGKALTDDERAWHSNWRGSVRTVTSAEEAIAVVRQEVTFVEI